MGGAVDPSSRAGAGEASRPGPAQAHLSAVPDRRIRVAYIGHVARLSGGELSLARLITALGTRVEAHVILAEDGPLVPLLEDLGARVHIVELHHSVREVRRDNVGDAMLNPQRTIASAQHFAALTRRLRAIDPDIIHNNTLKAGVYGSLAARLLRIPCVWHVRDRIADDYMPPRTARVVREIIRRLPDVAVANSRTTLETLTPPRRGAHVVYNVRPDVREHLERDGEHFRVGIVGRLAPWKGQDVFLRAFAEAFPDGAPETAVVVGSALFGEHDFESDLRRLAEQLGIADRVEFRGFRRDVWAELSRLDVLVHASTVPEPFGQVVLEGLAAGLPVVATCEGGPSEIVTDGESGVLYPAGDVNALAKHLRHLRADGGLRLKLSDAGVSRAADFSGGVVARKMLQVYNDLLTG